MKTDSVTVKTDFCDWWTPQRIAEADAGWQHEKTYLELASRVRRVMNLYSLTSVIELGCGSGYVGGELYKEFAYLGIDASSEMLELAKTHNPEVYFQQGNIRDLGDKHAELVCTFAVLKHFSNEEFPDILKKVLAVGDYALLEMQIAIDGPSIADTEGTEDTFHHTWTSKADLLRAIDAAGHSLKEYTHYVPAGQNKELAFVLTRKK